MEKGRPRRPFHEFWPCKWPGLSDPKEGGNHAEGCLDTFTSSMPFTKTEISLDIGPPSFLFVADEVKVSDPSPITRPTMVEDRIPSSCRSSHRHDDLADHMDMMIVPITWT
ncbi:hypothetical protein AB4Z34_21665 [Ensifer sp. 2YAB10]|uniref:hypothetical protein n=1 Tax=unclassified Ensifer TaxID=2633371 RepID=UPI003F900361